MVHLPTDFGISIYFFNYTFAFYYWSLNFINQSYLKNVINLHKLINNK